MSETTLPVQPKQWEYGISFGGYTFRPMGDTLLIINQVMDPVNLTIDTDGVKVIDLVFLDTPLPSEEV